MDNFIDCVRDNIEEITECLNDIDLNLKEIPSVYEPIYNLNNFIDELKKNNLYSKEMEDFIDVYMRLYNE